MLATLNARDAVFPSSTGFLSLYRYTFVSGWGMNYWFETGDRVLQISIDSFPLVPVAVLNPWGVPSWHHHSGTMWLCPKLSKWRAKSVLGRVPGQVSEFFGTPEILLFAVWLQRRHVIPKKRCLSTRNQAGGAFIRSQDKINTFPMTITLNWRHTKKPFVQRTLPALFPSPVQWNFLIDAWCTGYEQKNVDLRLVDPWIPSSITLYTIRRYDWWKRWLTVPSFPEKDLGPKNDQAVSNIQRNSAVLMATNLVLACSNFLTGQDSSTSCDLHCQQERPPLFCMRNQKTGSCRD